MELRKIVLMAALQLSLVWDLITTFLGTLLILGSRGFVQFGISLTGTLIAGALNFSTKAIWEARTPRQEDMVVRLILVRFIWFLCICFDFLTSLACNATYVAYEGFNVTSVEFSNLFRNLNNSQSLVVIFITVLTTFSPMAIAYLKEQDTSFYR